MDTNKLPFGSQFTPEQANLRRLLQLAQEFDGKTNKEFISEIEKEFFSEKGTPYKLAENTVIGMKNYELISRSKYIQITPMGKMLLSTVDDESLIKEFAKHILLNLNGLILVETLRQMHLSGESITKESVNLNLAQQGFELAQTAMNAQVMKQWLAEAGVIVGKWRINEAELRELLDIESKDIPLFKGLTREQYFFLMALCNASTDEPLPATEIRKLATASFDIVFDESPFAANVIKPLHNKGLIIAQKTTSGRGAKPYTVQLSDTTKREAIGPLLNQFRDQVGNALADAFYKSYAELRVDIDSKDTYTKGLALEAFAIKVMRIIGLNFLSTRLKGTETGGAEVDVLFDSTRLMYSRWQVQCKNTKTVDIGVVAKEVGLSHLLKSNVIVIMTTGHLTGEAKKYARKIMEDMNLCILVLEKEDIDCIIANPPSIVDIFNRQSEEVKKIKILPDREH